MGITKVESVNCAVLRECREQLALDHSVVQKKVGSILDIENGKKLPTFRQLDMLSNIYRVPRWVFVSEELPARYKFNKSLPSFRRFAATQAKNFEDAGIRSLTADVEKLREFILEMREDMDEPIGKFEAPEVADKVSPKETANAVRQWLGVDGNHELSWWKSRIEEKSVFIFFTSKYKGWSHIDESHLRGMSIYHNILPIIIINNSDAKKAQLFTLFHELGHLLRRESKIDGQGSADKKVENWCDEFAGAVLMPDNIFSEKVKELGVVDLQSIKRVADFFKVSSSACLVRMHQLAIIDWQDYSKFWRELEKDIKLAKAKLKASGGGAPRSRVKEVLNEYGRIYVGAAVQSYRNQEISLHKLCKLLNLKRADQALEVGRML